MHPTIHNNFICSSQKLRAIHISINSINKNWHANASAMEYHLKMKRNDLLIHLGNAAWGASFPSERALPAGGFGSVHTPSP